MAQEVKPIMFNTSAKRLEGLEHRLITIENTLVDLSTEISILKTTFAKLNARITTDVREAKKRPDAEALLEDLLGGKIISVTGGQIGDKSKQPVDRNSTSS